MEHEDEEVRKRLALFMVNLSKNFSVVNYRVSEATDEFRMAVGGWWTGCGFFVSAARTARGGPVARYLELAPKNWTGTRARLKPEELSAPLSAFEIPAEETTTVEGARPARG